VAKRYVLLLADADLSDAETKQLSALLEERHPGARLIAVEDNPRAAIVKTTAEVAPLFRDPANRLTIGGKRLTPVLTSGAIGNLKRRASGGAANGKVHE
jgi:hypothetical protein